MMDHKQWIRGVYDRAASEYGEAGCSFFEYFGRNLIQFSGVKPDVRALDVASGKGAVLLPLADIVGPKGEV